MYIKSLAFILFLKLTKLLLNWFKNEKRIKKIPIKNIKF